MQLDIPGSELVEQKKLLQIGSQKKKSYVSQSAVALRCRVMPPPCIKNPYLNSVSAIDVDIFCDRRSKLTGLIPVFLYRVWANVKCKYILNAEVIVEFKIYT